MKLTLIFISIFLSFIIAEDSENESSELRDFEESINSDQNGDTTEYHEHPGSWHHHHKNRPILNFFLDIIFNRLSDNSNNSTAESKKHPNLNQDTKKQYRNPISYQQYPFSSGIGSIFDVDSQKEIVIIPKLSSHFIGENLVGINYSLQFLHSGFGLKVTHTNFTEVLYSSAEFLTFTDVMLTKQLIVDDYETSINSDLQGSIGFKYIVGNDSHLGLKAGIQYMYFTQPIHFGFNMSYSKFEGSYLIEFHPEISTHYERLEFTLGYKFIGTSTEDLSGPSISLGLWF